MCNSKKKKILNNTLEEFILQLRCFHAFAQITKTPPLLYDIADIIYFHIP